MGKGREWTREEIMVAYALYCVIPFSKINNSNKTIQEAATVIGRSPQALKMKMCNLATLDPDFQASGRAGLSSVSTRDKEVFAEFSDNWPNL